MGIGSSVLSILTQFPSRSTAALLLPSQRLCGTILLTMYSMVGDWLVLIMSWAIALFIGLWLASYLSSSVGPYSFFFLSMGWYCEAGVFGLIGCLELSPGFPLKTVFKNNNNNATMGRDTLMSMSFAALETYRLVYQIGPSTFSALQHLPSESFFHGDLFSCLTFTF